MQQTFEGEVKHSVDNVKAENLVPSDIIEEYSVTTNEEEENRTKCISQEKHEELDVNVEIPKTENRWKLFNFFSQLSLWLFQGNCTPRESLRKFLETTSPSFIQSPENFNSSDSESEELQRRKSIEELLDNWEWILSKSEELNVNQSKKEAISIEEELKNLRKTGYSLKFRNFFLVRIARPAIEALSEEDRLALAIVLDTSKVSKIINDIVSSTQDKWLRLIEAAFFSRETEDSELEEKWKKFMETYQEKPYERNIVGSLKELAFSASHGPKDIGINERVLADILWSIWKTLMEAIRNALNRDLEYLELLLLANEISHVKEHLIHLWTSTVKISQVGTSHQGAVVMKWKEEQQQAKQEMLSKVKEMGVDAKWTGGKVNAMKKGEFKEFKRVQMTLEEKLSFSVV